VIASRAAAKNAAKELGLYALHTAPPEIDRNVLEIEHFQTIDNDGAVVHRILLEGGEIADLRPEQREAWACFVTSLYMRSPRSLKLVAEHGARVLEDAYASDIVGDFRKAYEKHRGADGKVAGDLSKAAAAEISVSSSLRLLIEDALWSVRDVAHARNDLLIGDDPVLRGGRWRYDEFFALALPISPTQLFYATNAVEIADRLKAMDVDQLVELANHDGTTKSVEYVYGTSDAQLAFVEQRLGQEVDQGNVRLWVALGFCPLSSPPRSSEVI
jgi:hypothetical protein